MITAITEQRPVQVGSTITNGCLAVRITGREPDGWVGAYISFRELGATGTGVKVTDDQLATFRHAPFEWSPIKDAPIEERYVWVRGPADRWDHLRHETRRAQA